MNETPCGQSVEHEAHGWSQTGRAGHQRFCPGLQCTCPHIRLGSEETDSRNWSDACPLHGVGTDFFRSLPTAPFGYASERETTREQWLEYLASEGLRP